MSTPYITPDILINAPTGISWETIPDFGSSLTAQLAEQTNICWRATHFIDSYCNQPLRATIDTEEVLGPDFRMTIDRNGLVRVVASRWPVTSVLSAKYSAAYVVPPQWQAIPANVMYVENSSVVDGEASVVGATGPSAILISPGYATWAMGRRGVRLSLTYLNGYAHAGILANAQIGATTLSVDDCTGMAGQFMQIYDGASTETVKVTSTSVASGPGAATLETGLVYQHAASTQAPIIISTIPASVQQAAIFYATYVALTRGATATTVQTMPGASVGGSGVSGSALLDHAHDLLKPYRRVF